MKFLKATAEYERWLGRHIKLIPDDLDRKHKRMRKDPFEFLRATFYRWAQVWQEVCGPAAGGPEALCTGDLHIENFGTWRDAEGRLVWGINDFDEAFPLPFTGDLIRLATSARFAALSCSPKESTAAILDGYTESVDKRGLPFVLAEGHDSLREMAMDRLHHPEKFWDELKVLDPVESVPRSASKALAATLPARVKPDKVVHRIAGLGSLGRERYMVLADSGGGLVAREAKALAPSACYFAAGENGGRSYYRDILQRAVRCPDPFVQLDKRWIVRRHAPDCSRIELDALPKERDELRLLRAMGWETANIHLGSVKQRALKAALKDRPRGWLHQAAQKMERVILQDFRAYKQA